LDLGFEKVNSNNLLGFKQLQQLLLFCFPVPPPGCRPKADIPVPFLLKLLLPIDIVVPKQLIAVVGGTIGYKGKFYTRLGMGKGKVNYETTACIFGLN
jgi:hypothetical protein